MRQTIFLQLKIIICFIPAILYVFLRDFISIYVVYVVIMIPMCFLFI